MCTSVHTGVFGVFGVIGVFTGRLYTVGFGSGQNLPYLREQTERAGRDPAAISISLKRSLHFTDLDARQGESVISGGAVIATTREVIDDVYYCRELGIDQLTYDFRVEGADACIRVMEHLAAEVLPVAQRLG